MQPTAESSDLSFVASPPGTPFTGLRVLVVGLGRFGGGVGVIRYLARQGAVVTVTDHASPESLAESVRALGDVDVRLHLGGHDPRDLDGTDLVVLNPAVDKARSDLYQTVVRRHIPWTTEISIFCQRCMGDVIAVTGTYGKSTTCAMLAEAFEACRKHGTLPYTGVYLGGNIGGSLLDHLERIRATDVIVLEISSAQLEHVPHIRWTPRVAVITNLSPHHGDRYKGYTDYVSAKLNIVGNPEPTGRLIVGELDAEAEGVLQAAVSDKTRVVRVARPEPPIALRVPGDHNQANAAAVSAVCDDFGLPEATVREALESFAGLPHRLQHVRELDGVDYYNDSKSTSPAATIVALKALQRPILAIVGGQDKGVSLTRCAEALARRARLVVCIGESGPRFAKAVRASAGQEAVATVRSSDGLEEALRLAHAEARPGEVVLFSPGAPSFDAYANFTDRGRCFMAAVNALS